MGPTYCLKSTLTLHQSTATAASLIQPSLVDLCPAHIDHVQARLRQGPPPAETLRSAQAGASLSRRTRPPCRALAAATGAPLGPGSAGAGTSRAAVAATGYQQSLPRDTSSHGGGTAGHQGHQQPRPPAAEGPQQPSLAGHQQPRS